MMEANNSAWIVSKYLSDLTVATRKIVTQVRTNSILLYKANCWHEETIKGSL
jgi:hypothetical protein